MEETEGLEQLGQVFRRSQGDTPIRKNSDTDPPRRKVADREIPEEEWEEYRTRPYAAKPDCPICKGMGYLRNDLPREHPDFGNLMTCTAPGCLEETWQAYRRGPEALKAKGVFRYNQTFDNFETNKDNADAYHAAQELAAGTAPFIMLAITGKPGSGKTHLANAFAHHVNSRGIDCRFYTVADLLSYWNMGIEDVAGHGYEQRVEETKNIPCLVLDDFKPEYSSRRGADRIEELSDYRYRMMLVTFLTSNRDVTEIPERIRSRFFEKGVGRVVRNMADDYRMRK